MNNEHKCKKFKDICVVEKLTSLHLNTHCLTNRIHQKNQVPVKSFFVLLIVICCSYAGVDAYPGNDAEYNIPSQKVSNQLSLMNYYPGEHDDRVQRRSHEMIDKYYDGSENQDGLDTETNVANDVPESLIDLHSSPYYILPIEESEEVENVLNDDSQTSKDSVLKRAPSYNSWRKGKRAPSYNSWRKGKRAPSYNSWRKGKRAPSYGSWKNGKRVPSYGSWKNGKRAPSYGAWTNGKRVPSYNSWKTGKRVPSYNSWRKGKRSAVEIKRDSYTAWRKGKRVPSYNSWRKGKRGPSYNSWRKGKRTPELNEPGTDILSDYFLAKQGYPVQKKSVNTNEHDILASYPGNFDGIEESPSDTQISEHHSIYENKRNKRETEIHLNMADDENMDGPDDCGNT